MDHYNFIIDSLLSKAVCPKKHLKNYVLKIIATS